MLQNKQTKIYLKNPSNEEGIAYSRFCLSKFVAYHVGLFIKMTRLLPLKHTVLFGSSQVMLDNMNIVFLHI